VRSSQNHLLYYRTSCANLIFVKFFKVNIHIYDSVISNGLKTFTSDCFNISEDKRKSKFMKINYIRSCSEAFWMVVEFTSFTRIRTISVLHYKSNRHICNFYAKASESKGFMWWIRIHLDLRNELETHKLSVPHRIVWCHIANGITQDLLR
jgi:phosphorylcholine metabolism protein LicD